MAILIWTMIWFGAALAASVIAMAVVGFIHGETKEEVISEIKTLITGEEL